jgi:hypothetical protein
VSSLLIVDYSPNFFLNFVRKKMDGLKMAQHHSLSAAMMAKGLFGGGAAAAAAGMAGLAAMDPRSLAMAAAFLPVNLTLDGRFHPQHHQVAAAAAAAAAAASLQHGLHQLQQEARHCQVSSQFIFFKF